MTPRTVSPDHGWLWIAQGLRLFGKAVARLISMTILLILLCFFAPLLGPLIFAVIFPALFAGVLVGCRRLENNQPLALALLFAGFKANVPELLKTGGVSLLAAILMVSIGAGTSAVPVSAFTLAAAWGFVGGMGVALLLACALLPLLMLMWFAPALIVFHHLTAVAAMKQSFAACRMNAQPLLIYILVMGIAGIVIAAVSLLGLLILLPLAFCSAYMSYKDVFIPSTSDRR